ncbi:hypothetical protein NUU61_006961 [Penicillium alfredii]|uniref:EXS domain-containing protein n=1 Tax=Penicillium alfredii TaxID=1506179 RepID=A0A9W9F201_9EURO|nr:uncharacterized protein NUU61_006961 [Penicillium alfredii]KAJ5092091.1 hypothetical protein NUU61_006961 [Penicillium alfredii]
MPGPDQLPQLDGFGITFPFPIRVAVCLVAGFWGFAVNLHVLKKANIDVPSLIRYPARTSSQRPHHIAAYRLAAFFSVPIATWYLIFLLATHRSRELVEQLDFIPLSVFVILLAILAWPYNRASRNGRIRLLKTLRRISIGGLAETQDGKFGDILLADALTSYSRVLGDLFVSFCMFFTYDISATSKPDRQCRKEFIVPLVVSLPSLIRFRQCLIEYIRARRATSPAERGRENQHLANALKYATALPMIWFAPKLRFYTPKDFHGYSEMTMWRLLFFFTFVNSAYTFWWDVVKDWDLTLFSPDRISKDYPYGLRRHRCFSSYRVYHYAIAVDLALRFTWLWRMFPGLGWLPETESGLFTLMMLEIFRRWMWVFFRIEAEWVRNTRGPVPDDVLLGDYNHKFDTD